MLGVRGERKLNAKALEKGVNFLGLQKMKTKIDELLFNKDNNGVH